MQRNTLVISGVVIAAVAAIGFWLSPARRAPVKVDVPVHVVPVAAVPVPPIDVVVPAVSSPLPAPIAATEPATKKAPAKAKRKARRVKSRYTRAVVRHVVIKPHGF